MPGRIQQGLCCGVRKLGSTEETPGLEVVQGKSCQRVTHQAGDYRKVDFGCFQPWKNKLNSLRAQNLGFFSVPITKRKQVTFGMMTWQLAQSFVGAFNVIMSRGKNPKQGIPLLNFHFFMVVCGMQRTLKHFRAEIVESPA